MSKQNKNIFFLVVAFLMITPIALIYKELDLVAALVFLILPTIYLLFRLFGWPKTAHIHFRILLFVVVMINFMIIYYFLFFEFYHPNIEYTEDLFPISLLFHSSIIGLLVAIAFVILLSKKFKGDDKSEKNIISYLTLILFGITVLNHLL